LQNESYQLMLRSLFLLLCLKNMVFKKRIQVSRRWIRLSWTPCQVVWIVQFTKISILFWVKIIIKTGLKTFIISLRLTLRSNQLPHISKNQTTSKESFLKVTLSTIIR
jgi:hypothetical protein